MSNTQMQKQNKKQTKMYEKCDLDQISRKLKFWELTSKREFAMILHVYLGGWTILYEKSSIIDSKQP